MPTKVSRKRLQSKPSKPHPDFPLWPHPNGQWCKKIRGKAHYFGPWENSDEALNRYLNVKDDLLAGRKPRSQDGFSLRDLANRFLTSKRHQLETEEITSRTFQDYYKSCEQVLDTLGKSRLVEDLAPEDFGKIRKKLAKTLGPVALGNEIQRIRVIFNFAFREYLIDRPTRYGSTFQRPSKRVLRKERQKNGPRMFEADQIRSMMEAAKQPLKAMFSLGINCGFGNHDCATLPLSSLELDEGWVNYPRPKTAVQRRCPLWPETVDALREAINVRPEPKDNNGKGLVFVTKYGSAWSSETSDNPISKETAKLLKTLGIHRRGLNFYALRHTLETIGGEAKDQVAVDAIMGHARDDMASIYRERISDERLIAVTDFVREWLFGLESDSA